MWEDPIVKEVREARERMFAECGRDMHRLMLRGRGIAERWRGGIVRKSALRKKSAARSGK